MPDEQEPKEVVREPQTPYELSRAFYYLMEMAKENRELKYALDSAAKSAYIDQLQQHSQGLENALSEARKPNKSRPPRQPGQRITKARKPRPKPKR